VEKKVQQNNEVLQHSAHCCTIEITHSWIETGPGLL